MNPIILDMEWNQPYGSKKSIRKGIPLEGEVVQIGAVRLDENFCVNDNFKILVKPKYYTKMHGKVSRLTKISTADLEYGLPFPVALGHFRKWCGEDFSFLTWGPDDIDVLRDNLLLHKMETNWLPPAYDLQVIFDDQITKEGRQVALVQAVEMMGEPANTAHDALCDAMSAARVCRHLDLEKGLTEYQALKNTSAILARQSLERTKLGKTYASRVEALEDKKLTRFFLRPREKMTQCGDIVRQSTDKYISIATCEDGVEVFVRFKFSKGPDDRFSVARIVYELEDADREYYLNKLSGRKELQAVAV